MSPDSYPAPGFGRRFLALLLDGLIVGIPSAILGAVLADPTGGVLDSTIISALAGTLYFTFRLSTKGESIGHQLLGLRVVSDLSNGAKPSMQQAFIRTIALNSLPITLLSIISDTIAIISIPWLIAIIITVLSDKHGRGLHDKLAGTYIVDMKAIREGVQPQQQYTQPYAPPTGPAPQPQWQDQQQPPQQ